MGTMNDDYITMNFKKGSFYYGYEVSRCNECKKPHDGASETCEHCDDAGSEWCFEAKFNGVTAVIPWSDLGTKSMFNMYENISAGIEMFMDTLTA